MKLNDIFYSTTNTYNKLSNVGKILIFITLLLLLIILFKGYNIKNTFLEGYQQNDNFLFKKGNDIYDDFYASIYDHLVFNNLKDDYEVGAIVSKTNPSVQSVILDVGSGTGHHVAKLSEKGLKVLGIDISPSMVDQAKKNYPDYNYQVGDVTIYNTFKRNSFTHTLCLYFTIYYIKDKGMFLHNCYNWLMPGGYLILHLVNRDTFDPILPPGNPLYIVSPQKYAKERITKTKIHFNEFVYDSNFDLDKDKNVALFNEKFKFKDGKSRTNEHILYMEPQQDILTKAEQAGFIINSKIDMVHCAYESQYLYILVKPS